MKGHGVVGGLGLVCFCLLCVLFPVYFCGVVIFCWDFWCVFFFGWSKKNETMVVKLKLMEDSVWGILGDQHDKMDRNLKIPPPKRKDCLKTELGKGTKGY